MNTNKKMTRFVLPALGVLALATSGLLADEQLKQDISRFWDVAETEIVSPRPYVDTRTIRHYDPRPQGQVPSCHPNRSSAVVVESPEPRPSMEAKQTSDESEESGHFGVRLFGSLQLFDFVWGSEESNETNELSGRR